MSHYTTPLWIIDPANVGKEDPTSPCLQITQTGVTSYNNGIAVSSQQATIHLTTANITGMFAARVPIIPAPGAGKVIMATSFSYENVFNQTAFLNGGVVSIYYGATNTKATADLSAANTALQASTSVITTGGVATVINGATLTGITNQGLTIANATAAFDTGDGSANITIVYTILTL